MIVQSGDRPSMDQTANILDTDQTAQIPLSRWWWLYLPVATFVVLFLLFQFTPVLFGGWFDGEQGVLEIAQFLTLVAATVMGLRIVVHPRTRQTPWLLGWAVLATLGVGYTAGEETSWAQHFVGWGTPEWRADLNDQGETNLHNISSWLDQKPRAILEAGVVIGGIVLPLLLAALPSLRRWPVAIVVAPLSCLPVALIAELARLGERARDVIGTQSEIVFRPSEVQELFFFWFALLLSIGFQY